MLITYWLFCQLAYSWAKWISRVGLFIRGKELLHVIEKMFRSRSDSHSSRLSPLENRAGCGTRPIWSFLVSPCLKAMIENRTAWPYFTYFTPDMLDLNFQNLQKILLKGTKLLILQVEWQWLWWGGLFSLTWKIKWNPTLGFLQFCSTWSQQQNSQNFSGAGLKPWEKQ